MNSQSNVRYQDRRQALNILPCVCVQHGRIQQHGPIPEQPRTNGARDGPAVNLAKKQTIVFLEVKTSRRPPPFSAERVCCATSCAVTAGKWRFEAPSTWQSASQSASGRLSSWLSCELWNELPTDGLRVRFVMSIGYPTWRIGAVGCAANCTCSCRPGVDPPSYSRS